MATLRVSQLMRAGAAVTVVAPKVTPEIEDLARSGRIELRRGEFQPGDLSNRFYVVIAATSDPGVQTAVAAEAKRHGILLNVVDNPQLSDFYMPAVVERGDLVLAISTAGKSPFLAGKLRQWLEEIIPEDAGDLVSVLALLRTKLKIAIPHDLDEQKRLLNDFLEEVLHHEGTGKSSR